MKLGGWRWALGMVAAVLLGLALWRLPVAGWLESLLGWIRAAGPLGALVFGLAYVACAVLLLPASVLTLGAGAVYGLGGGVALVSLSSTMGAAAAFLLSRGALRGAVARRAAADPRYAAIEAAVGREGARIVLLTRLSPIFPYTLLNYAYGLTPVSFGPYLLASWLGMLPGTVMYVYLGAAAGQLSGEGDLARKALQLLGLLATIAVTVTITRLARRALTEATGAADARPPR
jgi:uncharacterized membrane protein YdjX (TVP38/TMEM64 family)